MKQQRIFHPGPLKLDFKTKSASTGCIRTDQRLYRRPDDLSHRLSPLYTLVPCTLLPLSWKTISTSMTFNPTRPCSWGRKFIMFDVHIQCQSYLLYQIDTSITLEIWEGSSTYLWHPGQICNRTPLYFCTKVRATQLSYLVIKHDFVWHMARAVLKEGGFVTWVCLIIWSISAQNILSGIRLISW